MESEESPVCDVCGKPATNRAIDMITHETPRVDVGVFFKTDHDPGAAHTEIREHHGAPKYGCEEHPAEIVIHRTQLSPPHGRDFE
jgi:hypothetical protein